MDEIETARQLGYDEGDGDLGMTYDEDSGSHRSVAYDEGRSTRRTELGLD